MQDEILIPFLFRPYKRDVHHLKTLCWQAADLVLWKITKKVSLMVEASIIYFDLSHSGILFMNTPKCKKLCFVFRYEQFLEWEEDAIWHNTIFKPDCIPQNVKLDENRCGKTRICTFGLPKIFSHYKLYSYQQIVLHL